MLKIFITDEIFSELNTDERNRLPFEIEKDKWIFTKNIQEADIIPIACHINVDMMLDQLTSIGFDVNKHYLLFFDIYHVDEYSRSHYHHKDFLNFLSKKLTSKATFVHTNISDNNNIYYDFLWNRQKAYMTEYDKFDLKNKVWTFHTSKKMYEIAPIGEKLAAYYPGYNGLQKYLCPNRIYQGKDKDNRGHIKLFPRCRYRTILKQWLIDNNNGNEGYLAGSATNMYLIPEEFNEQIKTYLDNVGGGSWFPVANNYYNSSYWSTYVETITKEYPDGDISDGYIGTRTITEKTWDPLIKGHFILPFGYSGLIRDIKNYGFLLPDWINYSYDDEKDDDLRFLKYLKSLNELLKISLSDLDKLYHNNLDILVHNRNLFYNKPYDSLYNKVVNWIESIKNNPIKEIIF